jgi:hypothetical protein
MKLTDFKKLHLEDYYWRILWGKSTYKSTYLELRTNSFKNLPPPVFFLSTGRCGTNWFTNLLAEDKSVKVFHEPKPNLAVQGRIAYEVFSKSNFNPNADQIQLLEEIFHTAREQYIRYSFKTQRRFIETNNHTTFFAPVIAGLFPEAKFVHLNRHPGEFVRSALRRNFYNNPDDIKRIYPVGDSTYKNKWDALSQIEKNAWLWNETNAFIETFKNKVDKKNTFYFNFNKLNFEHVSEMLEFLEIKLPERYIKNLIGKPTNVQKTGKLSGYDRWVVDDKEKLKSICVTLAEKYGYEL